MWNTIKTKLKNLFTYEVIEEKPVQKKQLKDKQIYNEELLKRKDTKGPIAKMTYQYPKERTFRFPLVDDENVVKLSNAHHKQEQKIETTYEVNDRYKQENKAKAELLFRNSNRKEASLNNEEKLKPDTRRTIREENQQQSKENIKKVSVKVNDGPRKIFKPTEVPSPIYGFHKRDSQRELEDQPAFMRRDEKKKLAEDVLKNDERVKQYQNPVQAEFFDTEPSSIESEQPKKKRNPIQSSFQMNEVNERNEEIENNKQQNEVTKVKPLIPKRIKKDSSVTTEIPYNVMRSRMETLKMYKHEAGSTIEVKNEPSTIEPQLTQKGLNPNENKKIIYNESEVARINEEYENHNLQEENIRNTTIDKPMSANSEHVASTEHVESNEVFEVENYEETKMPLHLLDDSSDIDQTDVDWILSQQNLLEETLKHFNVEAKVVNATQGPSVTRFEVQPALGVKVSKVKNLSDDLKLNMSAQDIRIEAPIPGKNTIGIEIPNLDPQTVGLQEIFESTAFEESVSPLSIGLGLSIEGTPIVTNIEKMPHGLIAGATGSGKSVCINTILISLLYKSSHRDVRLLLIDPKMVELAAYNGIPHLVSPVITDVKAATQALKWAVQEMEDRYEKFVKERVRDISRYNEKMLKQNRTEEKMPFLVIVIDELADLMMVSPQDVEDAICRIAQKARACGIHLLLATQRPSVDVITGLIKANIPTRIAFSVSSQIDSRTILDTSGAEKLLGKGDMLFVENGTSKSVRIQGAFVSDDEIERVANHVRTIAPANYLFEQEELLAKITTDEEEDQLLPQVIEFIMDANQASTSLLQRHFRIGYNRAARLIDTLESRGIINQQNGSKPREVLVSRSQLDEIL